MVCVDMDIFSLRAYEASRFLSNRFVYAPFLRFLRKKREDRHFVLEGVGECVVE